MAGTAIRSVEIARALARDVQVTLAVPDGQRARRRRLRASARALRRDLAAAHRGRRRGDGRGARRADGRGAEALDRRPLRSLHPLRPRVLRRSLHARRRAAAAGAALAAAPPRERRPLSLRERGATELLVRHARLGGAGEPRQLRRRSRIRGAPLGRPVRDRRAAAGAHARGREGRHPRDRRRRQGGAVGGRSVELVRPARIVARAAPPRASAVPTSKRFSSVSATRIPTSASMDMADRARALARELDLEGRSAFFLDWVPYEDRQNYLLESDVGVSLHQSGVEAQFAFRTRVLDYVWASLPMLLSRGDELAALVDRHGLGALVPEGDVGAVAAALITLLDAPASAERAARFAALRAELAWSKVVDPVRRFCAAPRLASDKIEGAWFAPGSTGGEVLIEGGRADRRGDAEQRARALAPHRRGLRAEPRVHGGVRQSLPHRSAHVDHGSGAAGRPDLQPLRRRSRKPPGGARCRAARRGGAQRVAAVRVSSSRQLARPPLPVHAGGERRRHAGRALALHAAARRPSGARVRRALPGEGRHRGAADRRRGVSLPPQHDDQRYARARRGSPARGGGRARSQPRDRRRVRRRRLRRRARGGCSRCRGRAGDASRERRRASADGRGRDSERRGNPAGGRDAERAGDRRRRRRAGAGTRREAACRAGARRCGARRHTAGARAHDRRSRHAREGARRRARRAGAAEAHARDRGAAAAHPGAGAIRRGGDVHARSRPPERSLRGRARSGARRHRRMGRGSPPRRRDRERRRGRERRHRWHAGPLSGHARRDPRLRRHPHVERAIAARHEPAAAPRGARACTRPAARSSSSTTAATTTRARISPRSSPTCG